MRCKILRPEPVPKTLNWIDCVNGDIPRRNDIVII